MVDRNKKLVDGVVDGAEVTPSTEFEEILIRLKTAVDVESDADLAKKLELYPQNISHARKKKQIPPNWFYKISKISDCSIDWLRYGDGPRLRAGYVVERPGEMARFKKETEKEGLGGWGLEDISDPEKIEQRMDIAEAVKFLANIFASNNPLLIRAIKANLLAFSQAADQGNEMQDLKSRVSSLESAFKARGIDRRSGKDRRDSDSDGNPPDRERRSGQDRRRAID